jgi:hypothetical protein
MKPSCNKYAKASKKKCISLKSLASLACQNQFCILALALLIVQVPFAIDSVEASPIDSVIDLVTVPENVDVVDSIPSIEEGATSTMGGSTGIFTNEMLLERYMLKLHL